MHLYPKILTFIYLKLMGVLFFYCHIHLHKRSSLTKHPFPSSQVCRSGQVRLMRFSVLGLMELKSTCSQDVCSQRVYGGVCSSKIIQVTGRIQFLEIVGLRSPFPSWLSGGSILISQSLPPLLATVPQPSKLTTENIPGVRFL